MAHLKKIRIVHYEDAAGRRVPKGTTGARKVRGKSRKWYGVNVVGYPPRKPVPLATDKEAARRMLADLERRHERGEAGMPDRAAGRRKLVDHLVEFERDLGRGLASRRHKGARVPGATQVALTMQRVRAVLDGCGLAHPADLNDAAPGKVADYLRGRVGRPRKEGGLSHQSADFHLAAVRRFAWWLGTKRVPVRSDLFDGLPGFDPDGNRVHARRAVAPDELARVLEAAQASPLVIAKLTGSDRHHLYLTAFATGFRALELSALLPESFDLDADPPAVVLGGRRTKNRRSARNELPRGVADRLRTYLAGKPAGSPVWPGTWHRKAATILRVDLEAAGVPYAVAGPDGPLYADFHALRTSFVTALAAAGAGVKELQELARHSDPKTTFGVYAKTSPARKAEAVNRIALPGGEVGPFAHLTREQLERALELATGLLGWVFGPPGASQGASRKQPSAGSAGK